MDLALAIPIICASIAAIAALVTTVVGRRTTLIVEDLKDELDQRKTVRDARLDYEYEARKRLYTVAEPLLFQMHELAQQSLWRVAAPCPNSCVRGTP